VTATIIDGQAIAAAIRADLAHAITGAGFHRAPGLAVVLVGEDPASKVYVRNKLKASTQVGILSFEHILPAKTSEADLLALVARLNADPAVDGILVQLPLPRHIDERKVIEAVDPTKDVDGFHPINAGHLVSGLAGFVPCTPLGCLKLIKSVRHDLAGARALVIGRSLTVGKPVGLLLLAENCTVTFAHSKTADLAAECPAADIVVAAIGRPRMVQGDWIKPGAIVIDVGINRLPDGTLCGDVDFEGACRHASAITPVPKGVGPMTIAYLLANTWTSFRRRTGLEERGSA
jgi:methylenetetrahydrofolate dehydrogenase (NADP+)/methenyltetrahydrofolate cyclohydrolase